MGLKDWAESQSQFIKLNPEESYEGVYHGYRMGSYKGTELVEYKLDDKIFSSGSVRLARRMDGVKEGQRIKITRHGEGYDTSYDVKELSANVNGVNAAEEPINPQETAWGDEG